MAKNTCKAVAVLVAFQKTGMGFDEVWAEIHGIRDPFHRQILRLKLDEDRSLRDTAKRLSVSGSRVQREFVAAYGLLRKRLECRGFDDGWLAARSGASLTS